MTGIDDTLLSCTDSIWCANTAGTRVDRGRIDLSESIFNDARAFVHEHGLAVMLVQHIGRLPSRFDRLR